MSLCRHCYSHFGHLFLRIRCLPVAWKINDKDSLIHRIKVFSIKKLDKFLMYHNLKITYVLVLFSVSVISVVSIESEGMLFWVLGKSGHSGEEASLMVSGFAYN